MSEEIALAVPTSVKDRRKKLKWTQEKLASEAGISTTAVHNLEAGKNGFSDKMLAALAAALKCRPADLLLPLDVEARPITTEPEILAFLARIEGLNQTDINVAFSVISNALKASRAGSAPSDNRDQSQPASRRRESTPSQ
jgi:transcriptional regulator with XRE-family HTH domain